jgi:CubicO group peptidase (beta-lactamase class C family)/predicted alpha/beta superfamily hydrolase
MTALAAARAAAALGLLIALDPSAAVGQATGDAVIERILAEAIASETDALRIVRDGQPLLVYDHPGAPDHFPLQSITKPIVALAVLKLVEEGHLESLDQPIYTLYPEWRQGRKRQITVRHLLTHTSGLQNEAFVQAEMAHLPDIVQAAVAAELSENPGETWRYNNKAFSLLAGIIERASGQRAEEYIQASLFEPLEIQDARWHYDQSGRNLIVIGGLELGADALTRIGQLVLDGGRYRDRQVIREDLIQEAITPGMQAHGSAAMGLTWFLERRITRVEFGDSALGVVRAAPLEPALKTQIERLRGEYPDYVAFRDRVGELFGDEHAFDAQLGEHLRPLLRALKIEREETPSYITHSGDGGQYLYIVPGQRLVAVRLIRNHFDSILESGEFKGKDTSDPAVGAALMQRFTELSRATGFWKFGGRVLSLPNGSDAAARPPPAEAPAAADPADAASTMRLVGGRAETPEAVLAVPHARRAGVQPEATPPLVMPNTEVHRLTAASGRSYLLYVQLPASYGSGDSLSYPVLYLTDAEAELMGMYTGIVSALRVARRVPALITVGVADGDLADHFRLRRLDYTPSVRPPADPPSGGAGAFLEFLREEAIPFIEARYRADPGDRGIWGHSLGGLFVAYALLNSPGTFQRYLMSSPSLYWDDGILVRDAARFASAASPIRARVYSGYGAEEPESNIAAWTEFFVALESSGHPGLSTRAVLVPDTDHMTIWPTAFVRGMAYLYGDEEVRRRAGAGTP